MIEVKAGYKQTELGVIPEDWEINILKGIVENNRIPAGIYKEKKEYGNGTKIIKLGNVFWGDYFEPHNAQRVSLNRKELLNNQVYVGDIIIALASVKLEGVGKVMYVNKLDEETAFDHNVALIRANKDFNSEYIFYYLKSDKIRDVIRQSSTQVGTTFLKSSTIQEFNILLPPIKQEQNAIVTVLSDTDALIEHLEKLIAKKKAIKQGTMQQLITGKKRLPGFSGKWDMRKLGEITTVIGGGTPSTYTPDYWNGVINWFTPTEIGLNKYTYSSLRKITDEGLKKCSARILPKGTVLLTTRAGIGDVSILMNEGCTNQGFQSLVANDDISSEFLYYLVSTLKNVLIKNASGSTFLEISPNKIKQIDAKIPNLKEQTAIATILSDMDAEIEALEQTLDKYTMIKQGMMQQLLTGRIRIHGTN